MKEKGANDELKNFLKIDVSRSWNKQGGLEKYKPCTHLFKSIGSASIKMVA